MTGAAPLDGSGVADPPVIDPDSLSRSQLAGRRCAVPNCRRPLIGKVFVIGHLPGGKPVLACRDCTPYVAYQPSPPLTSQAA
jgi:hypothetical protein